MSTYIKKLWHIFAGKGDADQHFRRAARLLGVVGLVWIIGMGADLPAHATGNLKVEDTEELVSVDLSWGDLEFTYTDVYQLWNPKTHAYDKEVSASWEAKGNWLTVENGGTERTVKVIFGSTSSAGTVQGLFRLDGQSEAGSQTCELELAPGAEQKLWFELTGSIATSYETLGEILITIIAQ